MTSPSRPRLVLSRILGQDSLNTLKEAKAQALELELLDWLQLPQATRRRTKPILLGSFEERILTVPTRWFFSKEEEGLSDRAELLQTVGADLSVQRIHVVGRIPPEAPLKIFESSLAPVFFEPSRGEKISVESLDSNKCITDPFQDHGVLRESLLPKRVPKSALRGAYLKVHGWHPDRWIRYYSDEALHTLVHWALKTQATHVCLAHSKRVEQIDVLKRLLEASINP